MNQSAGTINRMKVTIFGASGLLGRSLVREWSGADVTGLHSRDADIRDAKQVREAVERTAPDWIVLSAAYTDVDECESNKELAFSVNRDGALNVAEAAIRVGAKLLFLSTDYVFDGTKKSPYETGDVRNPQSVYGHTKADAEVRLLDLTSDCCIVRTSWLFGTGGKCFPDTILKLAETRSSINVVNDQRGSPTYVVDLAKAIIQLCRRGASGIVHVANSGDCTWFEFAREIVRVAGLSTEILPGSSQQFPRPAPRPAYSVLSSNSLLPFGITMPRWQDALLRYWTERKG
jgi:dTDP-4-dehydrorhamnose reductase